MEQRHATLKQSLMVKSCLQCFLRRSQIILECARYALCRVFAHFFQYPRFLLVLVIEVPASHITQTRQFDTPEQTYRLVMVITTYDRGDHNCRPAGFYCSNLW